MKDQSLGQKIKNFRTRADMSQMELELAIGASAGSISRIEKGKVNPTKETLLEIIDATKLNLSEVSNLLNIDPKDVTKFIHTSKSLSSSLDLDEVLQISVNEISKELKLLAAAIFTVKGGIMTSKTFTQTWFTEIYKKILPKSFDSYHLDIMKHSDNLLVKTVTNQKSYLTRNLGDATKYAYSPKLSKVISSLMGFKSGVTYPIVYEGKSIGAIFYVKDYIDDFEVEKPILKAFTEHIAISIANAKKYQELQLRIKQLENDR